VQLRPFQNLAMLREYPENRQEIEDWIEQFEQDAEEISRVLKGFDDSSKPQLNVREIAETYVANWGLIARYGSKEFTSVMRMVREGMREAYEIGPGILDNRNDISVASLEPESTKSPLLSEAVDEFVTGLHKTRTVNEVRGALNAFVKLHGDLSLNELKREHFIQLCRQEGSRDIGGKTRGSVCRPMSAETIKKKISLLRTVINRAIDQGHFTGPNPASAINSEAFVRRGSARTMPDKRPFELSELQEIFAYPWFTGCATPTKIHQPGAYRLTGMHYWGPVVALLTGCRAGEIGGLKLDEIFLDAPHPHLLIRDNEFRTTKGSYRRKVPLIDQLMALGFGKFVEQRRKVNGLRLFDDWKPPSGKDPFSDPAWSNGAMVRAFNTTLIPHTVGKRFVADARNEVTFHSFRGAFKTLLGLAKYSVPTNYIHEVIGHSKGQLDKRYVGEIPLSETFPAIQKCKFDGLEIPKPIS